MIKAALLRVFLPICLFASSAAVVSAAKVLGEPTEGVRRDLGDGTYAFTRQANSVFFRNIDRLKEEARTDAARFSAQQGKQLKVLAVDVKKPIYGTAFCSVTLRAKLLNAGDPELRVEDAASREPVGAGAELISPPRGSPTDALYADLLKLDDLRKRGILTAEEFEAEKKKVLERSQ